MIVNNEYSLLLAAMLLLMIIDEKRNHTAITMTGSMKYSILMHLRDKISTVCKCKWFTEFHCGRISTSHIERPGRPKEVTSQEMIDKIHNIVLNDR